MAATKVMKFWAVCLAVLGKLLASLGVSAHASAARREARLSGAAPSTAVPTPTIVRPRTEPVPTPARSVPLYGQLGYAQRTFAPLQLPPTIKQRIRAEAHGASPTSRSRLVTRAEPLPSVAAEAARRTAAPHQTAAIPAARRREHAACPT